MSLTERRKGANGELEVVDLLKGCGWVRARRTHDGREQALRGDIANGPEGFHLEVKRCERAEVWKWYKQATEDAGGFLGTVGRYRGEFTDAPLVFFRRSRSPWLALIEVDELLSLLKLREAA